MFGFRTRAKTPDMAAGRPAPEDAHPPVAVPAQSAAPPLRVICRVRPLSESERRAGVATAVTVEDHQQITVARVQPGGSRLLRSSFQFDAALPMHCTQDDVFKAAVLPLCKDVLAGYETAVFAYGHSGSGKTYSMQGDFMSEAGRGMILRTTSHMIEAITKGKWSQSQLVVCCAEIYNDELSDLLAPPGQQQRLEIQIGEDGTTCKGLSEVVIHKLSDAQALVNKIHAVRRPNSHCIFTLRVDLRLHAVGGDMGIVGKLHFVDLAPNDKGEDRERRLIQQNLICLGKCLASHEDRRPFSCRNSKLTQLLRDGMHRATLLATVSPATMAVEETLATCLYSEQAMGKEPFGPSGSSSLHTSAATSLAGSRFPSRVQSRANSPRRGHANAVPTEPIAAAAPAMPRAGGYPAAVSAAQPMPTQHHQQEGNEQELRARLAQMTQDMQAERAREQQLGKEKHESVLRAQETEERYCQLSRQLSEVQRQNDEQAYVLSKTVEFADKRSAEANALAEALGAARASSAGFAERLASRGTAATAIRHHVRQLCSSAEEQMPAVAADATQRHATAAATAADDATSAFDRAHETMEAALTEQHQLLGGLAGAVREASAKLSESVGAVSAAAGSAAASERASAAERLSAIGAAARGVLAAAAEGQERVVDAVADGERSLREQAESLHRDLVASSGAHACAARALAAEAREAHTVAAQNHEALRVGVGEGLCGPLDDLRAQLDKATEDAERHREAAVIAAQRLDEDRQAAASRRATLAQALEAVAETHQEATAKSLPVVEQALASLGEVLAARGNASEAQLAAVASRVDGARQRVSCDTATCEAAVRAALGEADEALGASWEDTRAELARLSAGLRGSGAGEAATTAALTTELLNAVNVLEEAREKVLQEVALLREQRAAEERIVNVLRSQQEALRADMEQTRRALAEAKGDLEVAREAMASAGEGQALRREHVLRSVVSGVEALLRGEFAGLAEHLDTEGVAQASSRIEAARTQATSAATAATATEERACKAGDDAVQLLQTMAAEEETACGSIEASQERVADAIRRVNGIATSDVQALGDIVGMLETVQDNACKGWSSARDNALAAAASWADGGRQAAQVLSDAVEDQQVARQELSALRAGVDQHRAAAEASVEEIKLADGRHATALADLREAHARNSTADLTMEAGCRDALHAIAEGLHAAAPAVAHSARQAANLVATADAHVAQLTAAGESLLPALARSEAAVLKLSGEIRSTMDSAADGAARLHTTSAEAAQAVRKAAGDGAEKVRQAASSVGEASEAQRAASAAALAAEESRWLDLERNHGAVLRAVDAQAVQATTAAEAATAASRARARDERAQADLAAQRGRDAIDELVRGCSNALSRQLQQWRDGAALQPLAAFTAEEEDVKSDRIFESSSELPPNVAAALRSGLPPRPSEAVLIAEFRGEMSSAGAKIAEASAKTGTSKEELIRTGARTALKELQGPAR